MMVMERCYSAHIGYLFTELPFRERFAAAARWGFSAIEHPAPYAFAAKDVARWLADQGLAYTQFGLISGDAAKGEKGMAIFPHRIAEFRESVAIGLDYAGIVGASMVHAMAGVLPPIPTYDPKRLWETYIANLNFAAEAAKAHGKTILIEAMSPAAVPGYFIATPEAAVKAIAATGQPNIKLLFDVFHTASTGHDPAAAVASHGAHIAHVHLADHPGRHEPSTGNIDFTALYRALDSAGYSGVYGCEYVPATTTEAGLGWLDQARKA